MTSGSLWWSRPRHSDRRPLLLMRNAIKQAIREKFLDEGFVEVETACLQVSPGNEKHLHAFQTQLRDPDLAEHTRYLHTSPELACKKVLSAGEEKIFTFAPVFRNRERGPLHHPEFCMLEWYRAGATTGRSNSYGAIQHDCEEIIDIAQHFSGNAHWSWGARTCDVTSATAHETVHTLFEDLFGIGLAQLLDAPETNAAVLGEQARKAGIKPPVDATFADTFSLLMVELERVYGTHERIKLEGTGLEQPLLLDFYPAHISPMAHPARLCDGPDAINPLIPDETLDQRFAQRFEVFISGVEVANGFGERTDAENLRAALEREMIEKERIYAERYPIDDEFIDAVAEMPAASGCAMGFDRLVMLATGAPRVEDVIWTPLA